MHPIMPLSRLYAGFLDLLYPRRCPVCSEIVMPKGNLICPDCMEKLAFVRRPVCKCCGKEIISLRPNTALTVPDIPIPLIQGWR